MRPLIILAMLVAFAAPVCAADPSTPPKPTYEELQQQAAYWKAAYLSAAQRADRAEANLAHLQDDVYATQQSAPKPEKK